MEYTTEIAVTMRCKGKGRKMAASTQMIEGQIDRISNSEYASRKNVKNKRNASRRKTKFNYQFV